MRTLVAAAIPEGSVVHMPHKDTFTKFKIDKVLNATPEAGKITWLVGPIKMVVPASLLVDVVSLP